MDRHQYAILYSPIEGDAMTYEELVRKEEALGEGQQSQVLMVSDVGMSYYHGYEGGESWSEGLRRQVTVDVPTGYDEHFQLVTDRSGR